jgi:nitrogen fixation NifU-like protein
MTTDLQSLYQDAVLDHNRNPRNRRAIAGALSATRDNPMCGDAVTVYVRMDGDIIRDVSFEAAGCAILNAAASMMTESVAGHARADAVALAERFHRMLAAAPGADADDLGPLSVLSGVRLFPLRIRCATLPWQTLCAAMDARRIRDRK